MTLFLDNAFLQVVNTVILAVTVAIEILVGIVHDDGFSVFLHQRALILSFLGIAGGISLQRLLEGCGVFECESLCRKAGTIIVPHVAGKTPVSFVNQYQVILLKAIDRNGLYLAFFLQLIHIDHDHVIASGCKSAILFEHSCGNGRQRKFFKVLLAHALVGRKHDNLVNAEFAVQALCALEIMEELQNVHVHDQRLAAAGCTHERQLVQFIYGVRLEINETNIIQPCIQICAKCFRIGKVTIQIHFCEKQCDILEVLPT